MREQIYKVARRHAVPVTVVANNYIRTPREPWSLDFVSDAFTDGRRFRGLAAIDAYSRECLALVADTSLSGQRVTRELDAIIARRGKPKTVVSDNGTELTRVSILKGCQADKGRLHGIAPGKPMQNGFVENFNGSFRDECLNFYTLTRPCSQHSQTPAII